MFPADVFASDKSLRDVASEWLARHAENGPSAVTELLNFVLKFAGCDIEFTEDHINDPDAADATIVDLQSQFQAVSFCALEDNTSLTFCSKTLQTTLLSRRLKEVTTCESRSWSFGRHWSTRYMNPKSYTMTHLSSRMSTYGFLHSPLRLPDRFGILRLW